MHQNLAFKHSKNKVRSQQSHLPQMCSRQNSRSLIMWSEVRIYMKSELQCASGCDVSEVLAKTIWGLLLVFRTTGKNLIQVKVFILLA